MTLLTRQAIRTLHRSFLNIVVDCYYLRQYGGRCNEVIECAANLEQETVSARSPWQHGRITSDICLPIPRSYFEPSRPV